MDENDWRNRGQEDYLMSEVLIKKAFQSTLPDELAPTDDPRKYNDHEHCDFCFKKIMQWHENMVDCDWEGYCTTDEMVWICNACFDEFKDSFHWTVVP